MTYDKNCISRFVCKTSYNSFRRALYLLIFSLHVRFLCVGKMEWGEGVWLVASPPLTSRLVSQQTNNS